MLKPRAVKLLVMLKACSYPVPDLYTLYGKLSSDIHGQPWNGPSVSLNFANLQPQEECLLMAIANDMGLREKRGITTANQLPRMSYI